MPFPRLLSAHRDGKWAAQPQGTAQLQNLAEGQVALIDRGTSADGYQSDVTRTGVLGKPSDKLLRTFDAACSTWLAWVRTQPALLDEPSGYPLRP